VPGGQAGGPSQRALGVNRRRAELAGGKGIEGAEAGGEFGGAQTALAVEPAEKVRSRALPLLPIAFQTAGDEIAVGIAPQLDARGTTWSRHRTRVGIRRRQ
jgi:hypothetical protein